MAVAGRKVDFVLCPRKILSLKEMVFMQSFALLLIFLFYLLFGGNRELINYNINK